MSLNDHHNTPYEPGALAVANVLGRSGLSPTAEQAKQLWLEVKAAFEKHYKSDFSEEVQEMLDTVDGELDTLIRDDLRGGIAHVLTGMQWPCNGDSREVSDAFLNAFVKEVKDRGIRSVDQVQEEQE